MKVSIVLAAVLCTLFAISFAASTKNKYEETDVFLRNMQLYTGSKQFFVKGIIYSPQPLGRPNTAGFCSKKINYQGVMYGACINENYFDGVNSNNGYNPKPNGPWFQDVWERDLPVIKDLGANTIRVYHMDSVTQSLIQKFPEFRQKYIQDYAATHKPFLDTAEKYGLKVIVPIVAEEVVLTQHTLDELKQFVEARVDEVGNHPALLMWAVGNELGLYSKPELRATVNTLMDYIREYTITKWNRLIPVTTTEVDLPESFPLLSTNLKVDIFSFNAGYRDIYLNTLFLPDSATKFAGWKAVAQSTGKPLLIGEFGVHNPDQLAASGRPDWVNQQYKTIVSSMDSGCIGGLFFEFSDESMRAQPRGVVRYVPAVDPVSGKNSTDEGVFVPDELVKKELFEILKSGKAGSAFSSYGYASDEWTLAGTSQKVLDLDAINPSTPPAPGPGPAPRPDNSNTSASSFSFLMYALIGFASIAILAYTRM